ncbi:hypothetical protein IWW50_003602 [Coemansia erecta]|nr:hypothetical protein GGF43_003193 [Coemansia sp. RSA 2618]KAJ2823861.1 hypothetical protein IWW50_003602 [Coemansia erecta]
MSVEAAQSCGNDHGFIFKRGRSAAVKAIGALAKQKAQNKQHNENVLSTPTPNKRPAPTKNSSQLDFPEPKRRLTVSPIANVTEVTEEISVPLRKPQAQPTPLISRTRTRVSGTPNMRRRATAAGAAHRRATRKSTMGRRRSTFSMRGKRASSIGGGFKAMPHDSVDPADFYRHISPELPEPIRLRQLLAWCARRTSSPPEWPADLPDHVKTLLSDVLREAVDDIHSAFERGAIATSWYHRPVESEQLAPQSEPTELQPHPENKANAEARDKLLARIAKLQSENDAWVRELKRASSEHVKALDRLPKPVQTLASAASACEPISRSLAAIDWAPASEASADVAQYIGDGAAVDAELDAAESQIEQATRDIEIQLDAFHLDMHRANETHKDARSRCTKHHSDLGFIFEQRRERAQAVATSKPAQPSDKECDPTRDLLRTLSATLAAKW